MTNNSNIIQTALASWIDTNNFETAFHTECKDVDNYHIMHTLSENQRNTVLVHVMHIPLPKDVRVAHLGTLNLSFIRSTSDHIAQWIYFEIEKDIPLVTQGKRILVILKGEIDRSNKDEIEKFGALENTAINKSASQVMLNKRGDDGDTPTIHESSAALGMIFRQIDSRSSEGSNGTR
jgi:hypothetical protein